MHSVDLADETVLWQSNDVRIFTMTLYIKEHEQNASFGIVVANSKRACFEYCWDFPLAAERVVRIRIPEKPIELSCNLTEAAPLLRRFHRRTMQQFYDEGR